MNPFAVMTLRNVFKLGSRENGTGLLPSVRKSFTRMVHATRDSFTSLLLPSTHHDFKAEVGDGRGSSVLAAPLLFLMRTFPEAPPMVQQFRGEEWNDRDDHELSFLLQRPNDAYSGVLLLMATILDFAWGDAYWLKVRDKQDVVRELWWVPRATMTPRGNRDKFITHYEYRPDALKSAAGMIDDGFGVMPAGDAKPIEPRDVVHFRFGFDPLNPRRGYSPLASLWREVATDDQAANFTATILRNLGVIGIFVSPKEGSTVKSREAVEDVKQYVQSHFTGDKRGEAMALGAPTEVKAIQYDMKGFDLSPIRDLSEERVCAALGLPAAVVGFGTGLQQTKVGATMQELLKHAWTGGIIPLQKIMSAELTHSLVSDFETVPRRRRRFRVVFDISQVEALWENRNEKHDRIRKDALAGIIPVNEAQRLMGYPIDDDRNVYLQPVNLVQLPDGNVGQIGPQSGGEPATGTTQSGGSE